MVKKSSPINKKNISKFLDQVKAFDRTISLKEFKNRQLALDKARTLLSSLIDEGFIVEEGLIEIFPSTEEKEEIFNRELPDFIIQKEDIRFLVFIEIEKENYVIDQDRWNRISINFDDKAITSIVLSWAKKDMNSCALDLFSRKKYLEVRDKEINFENESFSILSNCIKEFYEMQFVDWKISEDLSKLIPPEKRIYSKKLLSENFRTYFNKLKETEYRIEEKVKAQSLINQMDFENILNFIFKFLAKEKIDLSDSRNIDEFIKKLAE